MSTLMVGDRGCLALGKDVPVRFYIGYYGWVRDDRPLIRTRDDLLELIAHELCVQLSYLSKGQALAVADTILRTLEAARLSIRRRR